MTNRQNTTKEQAKNTAKSMDMSSLILRLAGMGIISSGVTTAVMPEMREYMIPAFALCASVFAISLFANLAKTSPKPTKSEKKKKGSAKGKKKAITTKDLMDSFDGDDSHLILCSTPYFSRQAKITPSQGINPKSIIHCNAAAEALPEQEKPVLRFSWRNADTGAFLGTRSKLDLGGTLVRPGQSVECLVTAEDEEGDMATSLATVLVEADLTETETPTERFHRPQKRESVAQSKHRRRKTDRQEIKPMKKETRDGNRRRQPRRQRMEEESSSAFYVRSMWQ